MYSKKVQSTVKLLNYFSLLLDTNVVGYYYELIVYFACLINLYYYYLI